MPPIVLALAALVPEILGLFQKPGAAKVADQVVAIAQAVTKTATPDAALAAIQADPALLAAYQKAVLDQKVQLETIAMQREKNELDADAAGAEAATRRAAELEGTASDLKAMPVLGPLMLWLRGSQRPMWGFGVMYLDYMAFSGAWALTAGVKENAFFVINLLVLGFLFGERAVKNVAPFITAMIQARFGTAK